MGCQPRICTASHSASLKASLKPSAVVALCRACTAAGIPPNSVVLKPSLRAGGLHPSGSTRASLAEYGTLTVEYIALSQRTGNPVYGQTVEAIIKLLRERYPDMVSGAVLLAPSETCTTVMSRLTSVWVA